MPWTLADLGAAYLCDLDASDASTITKDGSNQTTEWRDKSGNGRHARQPTASNAPIHTGTTVDSGANAGARIMQFAQSGATGLPGTFDLAVVSTPNAAGSHRTMLAKPGGTHHHVILDAGNSNLGTYSTVAFRQAGTLTWASTLRQLWATIPTGTDIEMALDGGPLQAESGENLEVISADLTLFNFSGGGQSWGKINQIVFMSPGRLAAEREKVQGLLAWKWDAINGNTTLVDALPAGHTYKSVSPSAPGGLGLPTLVISTAAGGVTVALTALTVSALTKPTLVITQAHVVAASALTTGAPVLSTGAVSGRHTVVVSALTTGPPIFTTGAVTGRHVVVAQSLTTGAPTLIAGAVAGKHVVPATSLATGAPMLVAGAVSTGAPSGNRAIVTWIEIRATRGADVTAVAVDAQPLVTGAPVFVTGSVSQKHVVVATALTTAVPVLATGAVTQAHVVVTANLATAAPILTTGTVTQLNVIAAQSLTTGAPTLVSGSFSQVHKVTAALTTGVPVLAAGAVTQAHVIPASTLTTGAPVLAAGAVTQVHTIQVASLVTGAPVLIAGAVSSIAGVLVQPLVTGSPTLISGAFSQVHNVVSVARSPGCRCS